jgi:hypothetical protein
VHTDYRDKGIGYRLCQLTWDYRSTVACGLMTSHPYAVKSLERAANCSVDVEKVIAHGNDILDLTGIPYVSSAHTFFREGRCVANSSFFVCHKEVNDIRSRLPDWKLGSLDDGEEFVAICFLGNRMRRRSGTDASPAISPALWIPAAMAALAYFMSSSGKYPNMANHSTRKCTPNQNVQFYGGVFHRRRRAFTLVDGDNGEAASIFNL